MIDTIQSMHSWQDVYVVGGARTFLAFGPYIQRWLIGKIDYDGPADVWFPSQAIC